MTRHTWMRRLALFALVLMFVFLITEVEARRGGSRGGGRGFSRSSPARSGSVQGHRAATSGRRDTRRDAPSERRDTRRDAPSERREVRHDVRSERREFHEDVRSERREFHERREDRFRFVVGATLTVAAFRALTCTPTTVIVNGVTFYSCGRTWYNRVYQGGNVTYVIVNTPPGY